MSLTSKLFGFFNRVWQADPLGALALRLTCDGSDLSWRISHHVLTTSPVGGTAAALVVDLSGYTVKMLAYFLGQQQGYSVPFVDLDAIGNLSALALYDQAGDDVLQSNGDHLYAFTNPNWAIIGAYARELWEARVQIEQMLLQMAIPTAGGSWLDLQGSYYAVPRSPGETDVSYAARIIPQVLLPKGNNIAIANVITATFGQPCQVVDVVEYTAAEPMFDGTTKFDGTNDFNPTTRPIYGLFDVQVGQDILGGGVPFPTTLLRAVVNSVRDAGTQLRSLTGTPSVVSDAGLPVAGDAATMTVTHQTTFNGTHFFDGTATFSGEIVTPETLIG